MTSDKLINEYAEFAAAHSKNLSNGNSDAANEAFDNLLATLKQIDASGLTKELFTLFNHPDRSVQLSAAAHTLEINPKLAIQKLNDLSKEPGMLSFRAEMTLKEWNAGRLKFR